jgi:hypothetical protein
MFANKRSVMSGLFKTEILYYNPRRNIAEGIAMYIRYSAFEREYKLKQKELTENNCVLICQKEQRQKCQLECRRKCQLECRRKCQLECRRKCQLECRRKCQLECRHS